MKGIYEMRLGLRSIFLDWQFFRSCFSKTLKEKFEFIFRKYLSIAKYHFLKNRFDPKTSFIRLGCRDYFYGSVFGVAVFQSMIIHLDRYIIPFLKDIKKPIIIDVGAHLGFFSLPLVSILNNPRIYAIEPVSTTFELLKKNIQNFSSISAFHLGLLDKSRNMSIYYNPTLLMYSSLFSKRFTWDKHPHREIVRLITLDSFCNVNKITVIHLLKIDAEGAEERILKGGAQTLSRTKYLFIECALDQVDNSTFSSVMSCLIGKGFNFQLLKITSSLHHQSHLVQVNMLFENTLFDKH